MFTALIVVIGLSVLILGHEAGHFVVAKLFGMKVDEFGFGFPPRVWKKRKGETDYSVNWLPFGGFVKIAGEEDGWDSEGKGEGALPAEEKKRLFLFQPASRRALVITAGVAVNFLIGWFLTALVFMRGIPQALVVAEVEHGSPAAQAGFLPGDAIQGFAKADEFVSFTNAHRGEEISIAIKRGKELRTFAVVPRLHTAPGEGAVGVAVVETGEPSHRFFSALYEGLKRSLYLCWLILVAFYNVVKNLLFHGVLSKDIMGPLGVFPVAEEVGHLGFIYLVQLVSLISLNLAVINLIPFPALDGGRLIFIAIEKIKGAPVSKRMESLANGIGFFFLVALMLLVTVRDVSRWF